MKKEVISYEGRRVKVEAVADINVVHPGFGHDTIFRDAEGRYFLRRECHEAEYGIHLSRRDGTNRYRCYVHQISVTAAILWALHGSPMRWEATALLMDGRGMFIPPPLRGRRAGAKRKGETA